MKFICTVALVLISLLLRAQTDIQLEDLNTQGINSSISDCRTGSFGSYNRENTELESVVVTNTKTGAGAFWRSLLLPGWGQIWYGDIGGGVTAICCEALFATVCAISSVAYSKELIEKTQMRGQGNVSVWGDVYVLSSLCLTTFHLAQAFLCFKYKPKVENGLAASEFRLVPWCAMQLPNMPHSEFAAGASLRISF